MTLSGAMTTQVTCAVVNVTTARGVIGLYAGWIVKE